MSVTAEIAPLAPSEVRASVSAASQVFYGVGQVAGQVFRDVPSLLLLFFMTNALGVAPALAGAAIFIPKLVWGVLCDLGVGLMSDRLKHRLHRRWWLLLGAVFSPLAMILLFHVPHGSPLGEAAYVAAAFSLYMAVFSVLSVPYLAIASEMSSDTHQRTVIMAWRLVFTAVGVLVAGSFSPVFVQAHGGGRPAYAALSLILASICPVSLLVAFLAAGRNPGRAEGLAPPPRPTAVTWREALTALRARRFSVLLGANLLLLVASGMTYASMIYFLTYGLGRTDALKQVGIITLIACAAIICVQPVWVRVARRFGKRRTYVASAIGFALVFTGWGLLGRLGPSMYYALAVLLGIANSGWSLMGFSMVSDLSDDGRGGLYSSIWVAADKIGFALGGTLLVGLSLGVFGFDSARAVAGLSQTAGAVKGVVLAYCIGPTVLALAAAAVLGRWGAKEETGSVQPPLNGATSSM